jgi:hypothetical protein
VYAKRTGHQMSWANTPTSVLCEIRSNLLRGLDQVATHLDAGTLGHIPPGRSSSPRDGGHLTLMLLGGIDAELATREGGSTA